MYVENSIQMDDRVDNAHTDGLKKTGFTLNSGRDMS